MHLPRRFARLAPLLAGALLLGACIVEIDTSEEAAARVRAQDLGDLPYHPVVFHLDLSILAYQLYSQSLVWPFDPYYEDLSDSISDRDDFMDLVRDWAETTGDAQIDQGAGIDAIRGPGVLSGFDNDPSHDPILYQYSRLHPWSSSVTNAAGTWAEYLTPSEITDSIREVHVCSRSIDAPEGTVSLDTLMPAQDDFAPGARDILMAFEGGTGDKGEDDQPASQSLLGYALLRAGAGDEYDLHIAFRGSRSGSASRAALEAFSTENAQGNPDWITDLGYANVDAPWISERGEVSRGMSRAVQTAFPQIFACLDEFIGQERDVAPKNLYVTGHSLGGGLAQHFVSSLMMGSEYGPGGDAMPASLEDWPWRQAKLITFGAPRVGDPDWAGELAQEHLEVDFFAVADGFDPDATGITDLEIIPRLTDVDRAAGYRILLPNDPITTRLLVGGRHVGKTVYLEDAPALADYDTDDHEPERIRQFLWDTLRDPDRIPATAWAYREMEDMNPDRDESEAGSPAEYDKLIDATLSYYDELGLWFDEDAFDAGAEEFRDLLDQL